MSKFSQYEAEKRAWLHLHPDASPDQIQDAFRAIARKLGV
jgi:hypothetical protein